MNKKGFTLMEVVVAVGLLSLVSVMSVSIVSSLIRSSVKSQANVNLEQTSDFVLLKLENDVSKSYSASLSGSKILILKQPGSVAPVTVTYSIVGSSGIYYVTVDYGSGATKLTDDTSVLVDPTSSFSLVSDASSGKALAVNVTMGFMTPDATGTTKVFSAESTLNTTLVLGGTY